MTAAGSWTTHDLVWEWFIHHIVWFERSYFVYIASIIVYIACLILLLFLLLLEFYGDQHIFVKD